MAPEIQVVVRATQSWLQNSHHIHVPFVWLEACVEWIQEEAGGAGRLSQQQINQQVLDQWLLTDLRDLAHPVLPEGISQAHKTQLSGTFCVQVDSLLDVSQPAYGQLQKWRGSDCSNDEVSAVTQFTQRPWEARPTRMLLLQVTDGVQSLEAMEYKPIPALSSALRPGVKLQLQGQMVCRLGMILLGPTNIKVLGGEVEDLVERNQQGKVLCRTLGLPEEQPETEEAPPAPQQGNQEVEDLELDDAELLAGLEGQEEVDPVQAQVQVQVQVQEGPGGDSGYRTLTDRSTQSSSRSLLSSASSRSEASAHSYRLGLARSRGGSVRGYEGGSEPDDSDITTQPEILDHNMADDDFPDEDFDDLPLDELDSEIFHESTDMQPGDSHSAMINNTITQSPDRATEAQTEQCTFNGSGSLIGSSKSRSSTQKRDYQGCIKGDKVSVCSPEPTHNLDFAANDDDDFMDDDMDCLLVAVETGGLDQDPAQQRPSRDRETSTNQTQAPGSSSRLASDSHAKPQGQSHTSNTAELDERSAKNDSSIPALTLTSPPFTYLSLLEETMSKPQPHTVEIHVKAFIVTLLGKLSSTNGLWSISATISDGTGYLDVDLSDPVLTRLLGFSVAEKAAMKRDPGRRAELDRGMRRCQEELVDMCCVMTIKLEPGGGKAVVTKANAVSEDVFQQLERRTRDGRK